MEVRVSLDQFKQESVHFNWIKTCYTYTYNLKLFIHQLCSFIINFCFFLVYSKLVSQQSALVAKSASHILELSKDNITFQSKSMTVPLYQDGFTLTTVLAVEQDLQEVITDSPQTVSRSSCTQETFGQCSQKYCFTAGQSCSDPGLGVNDLCGSLSASDIL